jgi:hypothetical protein
LGLRDLFDRAEASESRVIDNDVDPAELFVSRLEGRKNGRAIVDVERERQHRIAVFSGEVFNVADRTRGSGDAVAALERGLDPDAPEPASRPRNEPYFL